MSRAGEMVTAELGAWCVAVGVKEAGLVEDDAGLDDTPVLRGCSVGEEIADLVSK